jgi:hypothetical protein
MNSIVPLITRRAFLGTTVTTTARASINFPSRMRGVTVTAAIDTPAAVTALECLLGLLEFQVCTIVCRKGSIRFLPKRAQSIPISSLLSDAGQTDALIIFGQWLSADPLLNHLLRRSRTVYVDDPSLASRIALNMSATHLLHSSMVGMDLPTDPSFQFAYERIRSGVMGSLSDLVVTTRKIERIWALETAAAAHRFRLNRIDPKARWLGTRRGRQCIHLCCERGQIAVPFYSPAERNDALPTRLRQFAMLVRGQKSSTISFSDMKELSGFI